MLRSLAVRAARRGSALAVQQQRGFAEAAVATQTSVWDELGEMVTSDEGKRELATLRSTYTDVVQKLTAMAKPPEAIAWEQWSQKIDPKLVQQFKTAYESMSIPKYEGPQLEEANVQFAALQKEAEAMVAASQTRIEELRAEIANIQKEKERLDRVTINELLAADPQLAKEIDEELEKNHFMVV